jgi:hypothetical protein
MPDIETTRGDSRVVGVPVFDADLDEWRLTGVDQSTNPTLADVDTAQYIVATEASSDDALIEKDLSGPDMSIVPKEDIDSVDFTDLPDNTAVVRIKLTPEDTTDIPADTLRHELQLTDINGDVTTVMGGQFVVNESVTNPPL